MLLKGEYLYTHIHNITRKNPMKSTALISVVGHIFETVICNYLLSLSILYSPCLQHVPQLVMALYVVG